MKRATKSSMLAVALLLLPAIVFATPATQPASTISDAVNQQVLQFADQPFCTMLSVLFGFVVFGAGIIRRSGRLLLAAIGASQMLYFTPRLLENASADRGMGWVLLSELAGIVSFGYLMWRFAHTTNSQASGISDSIQREEDPDLLDESEPRIGGAIEPLREQSPLAESARMSESTTDYNQRKVIL